VALDDVVSTLGWLQVTINHMYRLRRGTINLGHVEKDKREGEMEMDRWIYEWMDACADCRCLRQVFKLRKEGAATTKFRITLPRGQFRHKLIQMKNVECFGKLYAGIC